MKDKAREQGVKAESYDYDKDFTILSPTEKGGILETAKSLLKVQKKTALLADAPAPMEGEKQDLA